MAVLEVPELQAQLDEDNAAIRAQQDQISRTESDVKRAQAQHDMVHLQSQRLLWGRESATWYGGATGSG